MPRGRSRQLTRPMRAARLVPLIAVIAGLAACATSPPRGGPRAPAEQAAPAPGQRAAGQAARPSAFVPAQPQARPARVALLLPLTGPASRAAAAVRKGFMAAYYLGPAAARPPVHLYDTGTLSVALAVHRATQDGASFIVGPLTRPAVAAAAALRGAHPPMLALNFLPQGRSAPPSFYQFALSPVEEARQIARRIVAEGHHHGIAIVPRDGWGQRVLTAFTQTLAARGGTLVATAQYDPSLTDLTPTITQVLGIDASWKRMRTLESILGPMHFEPRRRRDIDFIFEASNSAATARLLRGEIRFYFAGSVPAYATSNSFEPNPIANQELEGLEFPDMPWMLGGETLAAAVHAAATSAWPVRGSSFGRLFAFGYDAYQLLRALRSGAPVSTLSIRGLSGTLTIDAQGRVHRKLEWAQMRNGVPLRLESIGSGATPGGPVQPAKRTTAPATPPAPVSAGAAPALQRPGA